MIKSKISTIMMLTILGAQIITSPVAIAIEKPNSVVREESTITTEAHTYLGVDGKSQGTSTITYPREMKVGVESVITIKYIFDPASAQDAWGNFQGEQMTIGDNSDAKFTTLTGFPRGDATVKSDKKVAFIDLLYAEDGAKEYKMAVMPNSAGVFEFKGSLNYAQGDPTTSDDSFESPFNISIPITEDNKQSITGSDYSMYVGDKTPVVSDFKASAIDKNGKSSEVTVDLSKADLTKAGIYDVTLKSVDGQSKVVKLTVLKKNDQSIAMYRTYNPNNGEHFYTQNLQEKEGLLAAGWRDEGIGWHAPMSGDPVYRVYNPNVGDHHYTLSNNEKTYLVSQGWKDEGIGWFSGGDIPLYRQYNPNAKTGSHNFTTSINEKDSLIKVGWKDEGISWYSVN